MNAKPSLISDSNLLFPNFLPEYACKRIRFAGSVMRGVEQDKLARGCGTSPGAGCLPCAVLGRDIGVRTGTSKDAKKGPQDHGVGVRNGAGDEGHLDTSPDPFLSSRDRQRLQHTRVRRGAAAGHARSRSRAQGS